MRPSTKFIAEWIREGLVGLSQDWSDMSKDQDLSYKAI